MSILRDLLLACFSFALISSAEVTPKDISGTWDFSKAPRKYAAWGILRQKGNRYPNFFAGAPVGGQFRVGSEVDLLGDEWMPTLAGRLKIELNQAAAKHGMEEQIPGGIWIADLKERPVRIELEQFSDLALAPVEKKDKGPRVQGKVKGRLIVGEKSAPIEGSLTLLYKKGIAKFDLNAVLTFTGNDVGLPAKQSGPLQLELGLAGKTGILKPELDL